MEYSRNTQELIDICNDILEKLVDFNLSCIGIDQEFRKLVQECTERDESEVLPALRIIEQVKVYQENTKQRLRAILKEVLRPRNFDFRNLEGFVLEQEVYDLSMKMMTSKKRHNVELRLKEMVKMIEVLTRSIDQRSMAVNEFKKDLDRVPKKSIFETGNLCQSSGADNEALGSQPNMALRIQDLRKVDSWLA